jgi:hypothetical protein
MVVTRYPTLEAAVTAANADPAGPRQTLQYGL